MKNFLVLSLMLILLSANSCENVGRADKLQSRKQEQLQAESNAQAGMPAIVNFQEKKLAKMIFELRDRTDLICYAYIVNHMTGKLVFVGKCIGYGLPYSVQYTNPEKNRDGWRDSPNIPQADPNGLFMPTGLSATWLLMIDNKTGETKPVYFEPEIVVSPFELN